MIKKLQERTPLSKGLDHLLGLLEKKDPQNFFAWPVTDNIAPGYSTIITNPMDFSTMRQKIEENQYSNLDVSIKINPHSYFDGGGMLKKQIHEEVHVNKRHHNNIPNFRYFFLLLRYLHVVQP